jgi:putative ABC transport system substrate-binding protein
MMRRRTFVVGLTGVLAVPGALAAQEAGKTWRIGFLSLVSRTGHAERWIASFQDGLHDLGYVVGRNVVIERRHAEGRIERLPALAAELVDLKVDVLVAAPAGSAQAARKVTRTVPIVFMGEPDPVGTGLVGSLARPGGNVTGLADAHADLVAKRLELLKEVTPPPFRVGVLWNPANPGTAPQLQSAQAAGRALGLTLMPIDVKGPRRGDVDQAFVAIREARLGSLLVIADPTLGNHRTHIAALSIKSRLPTSGTHRGWVDGGLLMSYGSDFIDMFRRGATLVDRIFKGTRPADLPVEQPTRFEFIVNLRTAKALELPMPSSLLARADQLIK